VFCRKKGGVQKYLRIFNYSKPSPGFTSYSNNFKLSTLKGDCRNEGQMMNAAEGFEDPSVWDVLNVIELLRKLRTNVQELGPTSEWYLTSKKTRAARE